jgi:1,4-alpha-glucan branching enzyme
VTLEPEHIVKAGLHIYYQRFLLYPDASYRVQIAERGLEKVFRTLARGLPVVINAELETCHPYNETRLYERLGGIWGPFLETPQLPAHVKPSRGLYRRQELEAQWPAPLAAGVFKYNKEAFGLLRFGAGSRVRPVVVFDDQLALEQASVHMGPQNTGGSEIPVCNRLEDTARFDIGAVVLTCAINFESEVAFVRALLHRAAEQGLPVISLYGDPLALALTGDREQLAERGQCYQILVPAADAEALERAPAHVDPRKTLGVFGTDSVQGKFTTQVYLREALARHVRVRHLATEPTGILTGADIGFSRVEEASGTSGADRSTRIRRALLAELQKEAELVITGGQNALTFDPPGADKTRNASTGIFHSVRPGWIVLTVAVDTPLPLIQDTLAYLEHLAAQQGHTAEVIAFAMLGGRKLKGSRWTETFFVAAPTAMALQARERIAATTGIPVFFVPEEIEALASAVLRRL